MDIDKIVAAHDEPYINGTKSAFVTYDEDIELSPDEYWETLDESERQDCIDVYREWLWRHS